MSEKKNKNVAAPVADTAVMYIDSQAEKLAKTGKETIESAPLLSNILESLREFDLKKSQTDKAEPIRLSFQTDTRALNQSGVYKLQTNLLPNELKKRLAGPGGDDTVNTILQTRSNHVSLFGRPRDNRFDIGFDLLPKDKSKLPKDPAKMADLMKQVEAVKEIIWSCGTTKVAGEDESPTFSQYLKMVSRDGPLYGYHATEIVYDDVDRTKFKAFRATDAGTMFKTTVFSETDQSVRKTALAELKKLYESGKIKKKIDVNAFLADDYTYCQVIHGEPRQFFTEDELFVHNLYPVTNVEYNGYPLTPIDQVIHAVTTHINITMHNKLYFQYGRAARGMLVIKSRSLDDKKLQNMRAQFHQTINSVRHAHKMPVFQVQPDDDIKWEPIDNSSRDQEFTYLSDNTVRIILGAFQISPDELPGYAHLSRGSNSQALSESNNEYKLLAARDVGIRPLLLDIQDFFNRSILPIIDKEIAKNFSLVFAGLDKDDPQKESARLQQDMQTYASMNDVLDATDKDRIDKSMGGDLILNPLYWATVKPYLTVGRIMENFMGITGASKDPRYDYIESPFHFQHLQLIQMDVQSKIQMMMAGIQQSQPQPQPGQPGQPGAADGQPEQLQQSSILKTEDGVTSEVELSALKKKHGV